MRKTILALAVFIAILNGCGVENQASKQAYSTQSEKYVFNLDSISHESQKEFARVTLKNYCDTSITQSLIDFYKAYNKEYIYTNSQEDGVFSQISISKNKGDYLAEASFIVSNSSNKYSISPKYGEINIIGTQLLLNRAGNVLSQKFYVSFIKNQKETFYYYDTEGLPVIQSLAK